MAPLTGDQPLVRGPIQSAPVRDDDRRFFEDLYRRETAAVRGFLRRLGAPPLHLEDLLHDVFVIAYQRLADYDRDRPARPWLFGIAFRRYGSFNQRHAVHREVREELDGVADHGPMPDQRLHERERGGLLRAAIQQLDLDQRAAFVLHHLEGCSAPEIAESLAVPLNTVYSRLRRALERVERTVRDAQAGSECA